MRFTGLLLLAALAGALVIAHADASPEPSPEDPASSQSDAPQETTIAAQTPAAAQETSVAAQEPTTKQKKSILEAIYEKEGQKIEDFIKKADNQWFLIREKIKNRLKKEIEDW